LEPEGDPLISGQELWESILSTTQKALRVKSQLQ